MSVNVYYREEVTFHVSLTTDIRLIANIVEVTTTKCFDFTTEIYYTQPVMNRDNNDCLT